MIAGCEANAWSDADTGKMANGYTTAMVLETKMGKGSCFLRNAAAQSSDARDCSKGRNCSIQKSTVCVGGGVGLFGNAKALVRYGPALTRVAVARGAPR